MDKIKNLAKNVDLKKVIPSQGGGGGKGRPMIYPYTFTAKIVQFPWNFYFKHCWVFRYYVLAVIVCLPIFHKISKLSNSPANVEKWRQQQLKDAAAEHDH